MKEIHEIYPVDKSNTDDLVKLLDEIKETLLTRTDGVRIVIKRSKEFPPLNNKPLITKVKIETWDIAA